MIFEISKYDLEKIDRDEMANQLIELERAVRSNQATSNKDELYQEAIEYYEYTREAVNEKRAREKRGKFMNSLISSVIV
jgi:ABC-type transporter lipoprotein component MlaA